MYFTFTHIYIYILHLQMYITFRYVYYIYICVLWPVARSLSGRIGKVVASHAAVARSILSEVALIYNMHETFRGYCP